MTAELAELALLLSLNGWTVANDANEAHGRDEAPSSVGSRRHNHRLRANRNGSADRVMHGAEADHSFAPLAAQLEKRLTHR